MCSAHLPHDHSHDDEAEWPSPEQEPAPLPVWTPDFRLTQLPGTMLLAVIRLYQLTLSRLMPPNTCRFHPSCSRYGFEAVQKYGVFKGGWLAFWRVMRCNPFNPGGYDPVP